MEKICIKKEKKGYLFSLHPWISNDAFINVPNTNEKIVDIVDEKNKFLARGLFNKKSSIAIKVLTYNQKEAIDEKFFDRKIKIALEKRKNLSVFRAFNAEGDGIPGLIIDVINDIVIYEIYSLPLLSFEKMIVNSIYKYIKPKYISKIRKSQIAALEGLDFFNAKWIGNKPKNIIVSENNISYYISLDYNFSIIHRENRAMLKNFAKDMNVLGLFCNKNGLLVSVKNSSPSKITSIDVNDFDDVLKSYELNKFKKGKDAFYVGDVYKNLNKLITKKEKFDLIIIDYPDFIKSKKESMRYFKNIVLVLSSCMSMLNDSGNIIFTTNSGFISFDEFFSIICKSTMSSKVCMQIFYRVSQPYDFPSISSMLDGNFFNCVWMQKIK